jgi:hypothetical protein
MNTNQVNTDRGYWLAWFLISVIGYGIGAVLGVSFAYRFFPTDTYNAANGITLGIVMGATGGYFQWAVLRERIAGAGLWTLAATLGFGLAMGTPLAADPEQNPAMTGLLVVTVFGLVSGILQWLILRRNIPRAGWWVFANLIGSLVGAIAFPIAVAISETGNWSLAIIVFGMGFGTGNGAITGAALLWLLRQASSSDIEGLATA